MNFDRKTLKSYRNTKNEKSQLRPRSNSAFTIVELLIVIVVIAIIAAIIIVSYNGITRQAEDSAVQSSLRTAANKVSLWHATNGTYPNEGDADIEVGVQGNFTLDYAPSPNGKSYCIQAFGDGKSFFISSETGSVQEGDCTSSYASIQSLTRAQCDALPIYTGSNEDALRTVQDARGGTAQAYRIAKLADDNCWMLDNLRLGSTSSSITLTPSDSDVASNFTLPQSVTSGSASYDNPQIASPVPGDGSGSTNYGYLYNWPAATAGETRTSMPAGSGNAPYSICPASWKLPSGDNAGEFAMLNAKMRNPSATSPSTSGGTGFYQNWQHTGPFKGVFAGQWSGGFQSQGSIGYLWSSSVNASSTNFARHAYFNASNVIPGNYNNSRNLGFGIRCLLD